MKRFEAVFCHKLVKNLSTKPLFAAGEPRGMGGAEMRKTVVSIGFFAVLGL
jgi:hypothetical protein